MLRNPLTWLLLLIAATALAACCGSVSCECQDNLDDALFFRFNEDLTTPQGFTPAQLDTVFIRRVLRDTATTTPRDTTQRPRADTVAVIGTARNPANPLIINNQSPFPQGGTPYGRNEQRGGWPTVIRWKIACRHLATA